MNSNRLHVVSILLLSAALVRPDVARSDPFTPFKGESMPVTVEDIRPHFDQEGNATNEFYSEWWSFVFQMEDGYGAYAQMLLYNLGPGDGMAAMRTTLDLPDGFHMSEKAMYERGEWDFARDKFEIRLGENVVSGPLDGLVLKLKNESFEAEYRLQNIAPPWKPGNGRAQYGKSEKRHFDFQVIAPVARMTGRVKVEGEDEWRPVKGIMYVDHTLTTIGMHEQSKRWLRFRSIDPKRTFLMADIRPPDVYGDESIQYAVLFEEGRKVFESLDLDLGFGSRYVDPKKTGYVAARLVEMKQEADDLKVHGAVKARHMTSREDFLAGLSPAIRFVVSKFVKPIMYYFDALYTIETVDGDGKKKRYKGNGKYYVTIVNP